MIRRFAFFALAAAALVPQTAQAGLAEDRAGLLSLQADDLRLQSVGWRLVTANAPFCENAYGEIEVRQIFELEDFEPGPELDRFRELEAGRR